MFWECKSLETSICGGVLLRAKLTPSLSRWRSRPARPCLPPEVELAVVDFGGAGGELGSCDGVTVASDAPGYPAQALQHRVQDIDSGSMTSAGGGTVTLCDANCLRWTGSRPNPTTLIWGSGYST